MRFLRRYIEPLIVLAAVCGAISLAALFSKHHIVFDLLSHFRVQYIVLLLPCFVFGMFYRKSKSVLIISLVLAIHGYVVTMSLLPLNVKPTDAFTELSVLNANLLLTNQEHQQQIEHINNIDPDVIVLLEYTNAWHAIMSTALENYPHRVTEPEHGVFGIALYSKFPIISGSINDPMPNVVNVADVVLNMGEQHVRVVGVHPPPPASSDMYHNRNRLFKYLATLAKEAEDALVIMGDFNATPWTAHFTDMTSTGQLRNARAGHGMHPTWPANLAPYWIPIDHVLVNDHIGVVDFDSARVHGSDHRNIWAELRIYQR